MSVTPKTLATELFIDPWKRLKYGFLPVRRVVDEDFSSNSNFGDEGLALESEAKIDEVEESDIEYRDEANRRWWNFFNEGEYRRNKKVETKNPWYSWFNGSTSAQEKKLILKLDVLLAFYSCMAYWVKYLDTVN